MADKGITPEARRLLDACEMREVGLDMVRQRLRREHPGASAEDVEGMVRGWVSDRPYDSPGQPVRWPRE